MVIYFLNKYVTIEKNKNMDTGENIDSKVPSTKKSKTKSKLPMKDADWDRKTCSGTLETLEQNPRIQLEKGSTVVAEFSIDHLSLVKIASEITDIKNRCIKQFNRRGFDVNESPQMLTIGTFPTRIILIFEAVPA